MLGVQYLQECNNFEIKLRTKYALSYPYIDHLAKKNQFQSFVDSLELNVEIIVAKNPDLIVAFGDFNTQTKTSKRLEKLCVRKLKLI